MPTRLWWVRPESFPSNPAALGLLSAEERARHQRFLPPEKRHEYLLTRVLVRTVLGEELGMAPEALRFVQNEWGRPELSPPSQVRFNVSHTDGMVVILVSTDYEVGVDTERLARAPALLTLAPRVFALQELSDLNGLPTDLQAHRAVVLWTLKESYIKARGRGLSLPLGGFSFRFDDAGVHLDVDPELEDDGGRWQFQTLTLGSHLVSTAIANPPRESVEVETLEAAGMLRAFR